VNLLLAAALGFAYAPVTGGGTGGTDAGRVVTSGGDRGLSGEHQGWFPARSLPIAALAFAAFGSLYMVVNAVTLIDQRRALGQPIAKWQAWCRRHKFCRLLALLPFILMLAARLIAPPGVHHCRAMQRAASWSRWSTLR
jgi:hypothetical protein